MIFCVPVSGKCTYFLTLYLNTQIFPVHYLVTPKIFAQSKKNIWTKPLKLKLKPKMVPCLGWPAGGEVFSNFYYLAAPTPMPPLVSLLCLPHAAPMRGLPAQSSFHRGRTYVGDLREAEQRESEKAFRVEFLVVAGLLLSSQGLHAFSLLIRECESDSCFTCKCDWDFL